LFLYFDKGKPVKPIGTTQYAIGKKYTRLQPVQKATGKKVQELSIAYCQWIHVAVKRYRTSMVGVSGLK